MTPDLHFLTIAEASNLIRTKKLSPVDLVNAYLERIKTFDDTLHAFILPLGASALAEAKKAEAEIAAGGWKGPLHGIPIGLKDIYNTKGIATTGHSALFKDHVPNEDATTVKRLKAAGAIVLGKLSTHEFATGGPSFDLPWPPARNPWNPALGPGGSSSGSGVAVAAGLVTGAMGTDTGGSIRSPAAWCGIAGLKPTYGLISRRGILPLSFSLDHSGPMCWTSEDCALMMAVLAGHDAQDPGSADVASIDFAGTLGKSVKGLRVGVVRHFFEKDLPVGAETAAALEAGLKTFADLGASVQDVTLSPLDIYGGVCGTISRSESFAIHERYLTKTPELYGELARRRIMAGAFIRASDYVNALRYRAQLVAEMAEVMKTVDVLVMPTKPEPAPIIEGSESKVAGGSFTRPFNVSGSPALSVCSGFSSTGLPLSMQIAGRPFEDDVVLQLGSAFEKATNFRSIRPTLSTAMAAAAQ